MWPRVADDEDGAGELGGDADGVVDEIGDLGEVGGGEWGLGHGHDRDRDVGAFVAFGFRLLGGGGGACGGLGGWLGVGGLGVQNADSLRE